MMRGIWLVARREYLGYVTAWGFWLGLILTPLGLLAGAVLPRAIESNQPIRYYVVVDTHDDFSQAVQDHLDGWRAGTSLALLEQHVAPLSPEEQRTAVRAFEEARANGETPEDALVAAGAPQTVQAPERKFVEINSPSARIKELERIMKSGQTLSGPEGPRTLFAALIVHRDQIGKIESIDYVSQDVVISDLRTAAEGALKRLAREELLGTVGMSNLDIRAAEAGIPPVINKRFDDNASQQQPDRETAKNEVTLTDRAPYIAASLIALFLWLLIFSVVNFLLTGTIEERSNKIFDSLLTCVRLTDLLFGKLLGVLMLSLTLVGVWLLMAIWGGLHFADQLGPAATEFLAAALSPGLIAPALIGFLMGYVIYGAVFLALGSLCDTIQEAQTLMTPLIIFLMIPLALVVVAITNPDSPLLHALSWMPFFTPFLMILRAPLEPSWIEVVGQTLLMTGFTGLVVWTATRIYRAGAVHGAGLNETRTWFGGWFSKRGKSS